MPSEKTWTIKDGNGTKTVTLAQFKAEIAARRAMAAPIMDAVVRGDIAECMAAQATFRKTFCN